MRLFRYAFPWGPWEKKIYPLVVIGFLCAVPFLLIYQDPIGDLTKRGVPVPKNHVDVVGSESGGFFAQWYFTAIELTGNDLIHFEKQVMALGSTNAPIGIGPDHMHILSNMGNDIPYCTCKLHKFKHELHDKFIDWWNIDLITNGMYYESELPDACGYQIFSDRDLSIVYIYWYYS